MPFQFTQQRLPDVLFIRAQPFIDPRGVFLESYCQSVFLAHGIRHRFVQDNISSSICGVLRGLHFQQHPKAQAKLVMPIVGEIFDVAVDIRRKSPTYGQWEGFTLSAARHEMMYVPVGFAHGFCVLSDSATVLYKVSSEYAPACERGIRWDDPDLAITWPCTSPLLSTRDAQLPLFRDADTNFLFDQLQPTS